jgi:hypothetical protein
MDPAPINPKVPALAAAAASLPPETQTIPAWMMGVRIPKSLVMEFFEKLTSLILTSF